MAQYGLTKIIHEPTHLHDKFVTNSGVHSSFHSNCHHQIIFSECNLKINYPPPYERVVLEYDKADKDLITKLSTLLIWKKSFQRDVLGIIHKCISSDGGFFPLFSEPPPPLLLSGHSKKNFRSLILQHSI